MEAEDANFVTLGSSGDGQYIVQQERRTSQDEEEDDEGPREGELREQDR